MLVPKGEPPNKRLLRTILLILAIILLLLAVNRLNGQPERPETVLSADYQIIQGNSIIGTNIPYFPKIYVLGALMEKIIFCESSNNPKAINPISGAKGLLQIIPSSEKFCEKGLERELDMFDKEDNLDCGEYLMKNGGSAHWSASKSCWAN